MKTTLLMLMAATLVAGCDGSDSVPGDRDLIVFYRIDVNENDGSPVASIYLYDKQSQELEVVRENVPRSYGPIVNTDFTKLVYASQETPTAVREATLYDISASTSEQIASGLLGSAFFDSSGNVVYNDSNSVYNFDVTSSEATVVSVVQTLNEFGGGLKVSADKERLIVYEAAGTIGQPGDRQCAALVMSTDGSQREVIKEPYLGWHNNYEWKPNGNEVLLYDHEGDNTTSGVAKYVIYDLVNGTSVDLSQTEFGETTETSPNIGWFLSNGDWASFTRMKIYDSTTGEVLRDATDLINQMNGKLVGTDKEGKSYLADDDGENVVEFDDTAY